MVIESLELENFRNYETLHMLFDSGTNIFYGDNAQGKTNILEALYICATTKSHKGSKDRELIRFGCQEAHIRGRLKKCGQEYQIDMHLKKNKTKGIAINKVPIRKASELFGIVNMIFFSPEDLNIIKNGPSERRRFLDSELCQVDKIYLYHLTNYNKAVNQRNKLLKSISFQKELIDTLPVWDSQLVRYGSLLIERRRRFAEQLNEIMGEIHSQLSGGKEKLLLKYEPNVTEDTFLESLRNYQSRDFIQMATSAGPHKDDLCFCVNGMDIRKYGSQGQQRTAALSLKLAEIELVRQMIKEDPVLLLDDVLSELDQNRQNYLLDSIGGIQTMITCTGLDEFIKHRFPVNQVFKVTEGTVWSENRKEEC